MSWTISNDDLSESTLLNLESLFALGNGYIGVRGNFEEGYPKGMTSIRGTYLNAFHDVTEIAYGEKLHAFPDTQQKLVNVMDAQSIEIYLGDEEERFSVGDGAVLSYERRLHMDKGYSERMVHWRSPSGKEIRITFRRLVSLKYRELFAVDVRLEPVNFTGTVKIVSTVNGDVQNYTNPKDPRVGAGHAKLLSVLDCGTKEDFAYVVDATKTSSLQAACVSRHVCDGNPQIQASAEAGRAAFTYTLTLTQPVSFTKWNVFTDTLRHGEELVAAGMKLQEDLRSVTFEEVLAAQNIEMESFWKSADIVIEQDANLQEGIRFNLYQLLQSVGRDKYSNIAAKGLSGEGYEGHYFWDTEIYMFPVFLMTQPQIAKDLLIYRYSILDGARARAKEMGHKKGALFPWRTISGTECSSFFPAGTAQYHISADIAYSYIQYYMATEDRDFLLEYGAEVLMETARLWKEIGHYHEGKFHIDEVTGPDEYTCLVNNNYYTNAMAKHNLKWAAKSWNILKSYNEPAFRELSDRLQVTEEEAQEWQQAADAMFLAYDEALGINPQDDTFLRKAVWDFENTPDDHYPLLLHYHPLTIYRYQVCKQADTVLAHFLLEDEQDEETIRRSYDYYERITTHDSSLSSCIFSIMAAKVGYHDKAYSYFIETARLDLDNTHGNTKDGLHMANMGGTWMAIVFGFAGVRLKETELSLNPTLPSDWERYAFRIRYKGRLIAVDIRKDEVALELVEGEELSVRLYGTQVSLKDNAPVRLPRKQ